MDHSFHMGYESKHGIELPELIQRNYLYTPDGGHCVNCIMKSHVVSRQATKYNYEKFLIPVPIKRVLRDYDEVFHFTEEDGGRFYVVMVDMEYDPDLGLISDAADDEY